MSWEAVVAKKWAELEIIEHEGRPLFPESIRRRNKDGKIEEVPIRFRVLRKDERRAAIRDAEKWAAQEGIDPEKAIHKIAYDDLENLCILARSIREPKAPYDQHCFPADLEKLYEARALEELWSKYSAYEDLTDPRDELDETKFWAVLGAMWRTRSVAPLAECERHEQRACVLRMVEICLTSPTFSAWYTSYENSTPEPSPSKSSTGS